MDRSKITTTTVERLIASQFPRWSGLPIKAVEPGGWDHRTFRLGNELVVRLPSAERYALQIDKEQRWLPEIAPFLPFAIPTPVALGQPGDEYPWRWSILRWMPGEPTRSSDCGRTSFAEALAVFLIALQVIGTASAPPAGEHNFHRGGALAVYDEQVRAALARLTVAHNAASFAEIWDTALSTTWQFPDVWVHGDVAPVNLILENRRLSAVIDWGNCAIGDPACDLVIAWTHLRGAARTAFREAMTLDQGTWDRARGWALWKALILSTGLADGAAVAVAEARGVLREILS